MSYKKKRLTCKKEVSQENLLGNRCNDLRKERVQKNEQFLKYRNEISQYAWKEHTEDDDKREEEK